MRLFKKTFLCENVNGRGYPGRFDISESFSDQHMDGMQDDGRQQGKKAYKQHADAPVGLCREKLQKNELIEVYFGGVFSKLFEKKIVHFKICEDIKQDAERGKTHQVAQIYHAEQAVGAQKEAGQSEKARQEDEYFPGRLLEKSGHGGEIFIKEQSGRKCEGAGVVALGHIDKKDGGDCRKSDQGDQKDAVFLYIFVYQIEQKIKEKEFPDIPVSTGQIVLKDISVKMQSSAA